MQVADKDVASGRPWHDNTGDNPAPYIDPITGNVTVLWRTYVSPVNQSVYFVFSYIWRPSLVPYNYETSIIVTASSR